MHPIRPTVAPPDEPLQPPVGDDALDPSPDAGAGDADATNAALRALETLPVAGFTRRRVAVGLAALITVWIVAVFARQVGEAAAATGRAEQAAIDNAHLQHEVTALQRELALVERPEYVEQQARAHGLGTEKEIPFGLPPEAPALAQDAPGSAATALGSDQERRSPLDTWLGLLFGPGD